MWNVYLNCIFTNKSTINITKILKLCLIIENIYHLLVDIYINSISITFKVYITF